jgi:signal transduction histidine kinase
MPDEIARLLDKLRAHRVPPLNELVDRSTIELIHRGFTEMWQVPLAIYWPLGAPDDEASWVADSSGRIVVPPSGQADCVHQPQCTGLVWRGCSRRPGCDESDVKYAHMTAKRKRPLIYCCNRGFLYLTMPVILEGRVIAVLFTGQLFPAPNTSWEDVAIEGLEMQSAHGIVDLNALSRFRFDETRSKSRDDEPDLGQYAPVRPEDLSKYSDGLSKARDALCEIASAKAEVDMSKLRCFFRTWLFECQRSKSEFWKFVDEWLTAWRFPEGAFFLALMFDKDPRFVRIEQALGLPDVTCGAYEIADRGIWERLRQTANTESSSESHRIGGLLKNLSLPRAAVVALPMGKHGLHLYGVRGTPDGPPMWQSDRVSARQFVGDMGLLLDQIEKEQAKEEFLQCFSHELRSPIHASLFTIDRIRKGHFSDPTLLDKRCKRLQAQINRLLKVIEGVWQLQTILAGLPPTLNPQRTNLYDFLAHCVSQASDMSHRDDVSFAVRKESLAGLPAIEVDPDAFGLVVFNLLDNALKYSAKNSDVRVRGWREGVEVVLTFKNIGLRIPPRDELDVFERFVRTLDAVEKVPHSSGIGLFLAKHIVEAHGGTITAGSSPFNQRDHLVTVTVRMPVKQ